jgi:CRP-like cAMP-binding protein
VPTRIATISRATVLDLFENHPRIGAALWWSALQQNAINRERIVALGRRSARGRVAYMLCELVWRQRAVGLAEDHAIRLPLRRVCKRTSLEYFETAPVACSRGNNPRKKASCASASR